MTSISTWPRPALYTLGGVALAAVLGWGVAIERGGKASSRADGLAAADVRTRALEQRAGQSEATLAAERRAAGDLSAINNRLQAARAELGAAEQARVAGEARSAELRDAIAAAERRVGELGQAAARRRAPVAIAPR